jgi:TolA-binding protein
MSKLSLAVGLSLLLWLGGASGSRAMSAQESATKQGTKHGVPATKAEAGREKKAYQKKAQERLDQLDKQIDELKAKAQKAGENSKKQLDKSIADLQPKERAAEKSLKELREASWNTWQDAKTQFNTAVNFLQKAYDRAVAELKSAT